MIDWKGLRVLALGGGGQCGLEIGRQLLAYGVGGIVVHDLTQERAEAAVAALRLAPGGEDADLQASSGDLFLPAALGAWSFVDVEGSSHRLCRASRELPDPREKTDELRALLDDRLGPFGPDVVRESLIWNLVSTARANVVVDSINTATVLGYSGDVIQSGRKLSGLAGKILTALAGDDGEPLRADELDERLAALEPDASRAVTSDIVEALRTSMRMTAFLDTACMIRFVQCLHALFRGEEGLRVPEFERYVKVHTTGLGGMGFNIGYTHGDTGEPGLSTKLLGKVCATGSLSQLLLTLAHTPECDVRVVVPAALIGWSQPDDAILRVPSTNGRLEPIPVVDTDQTVPCDGTVTLAGALKDTHRHLVESGEPLEVPYLNSGENNPYAVEDIQTITALGQMGCVTKEEVARAAVECIAGDSRYDVLTATDAALILPTRNAVVERDRSLQLCRELVWTDGRSPPPSVSLGNLGPTIAKLLYEIEIIRARYETVHRVVEEGDPADMTLRACSYVLDDVEGARLRRQILSLGIPIFLRRGPGESGLLLGRRLRFPDASDRAALETPLDMGDPRVNEWKEKGWVDLTGARMRWWHARFVKVEASLNGPRSVSRDWFSPDRPFHAGQFLAYNYSISGGQRKDYM